MKPAAEHESVALLLALCAAIDGAGVRMRTLKGVSPVVYAGAALEELGNIIKAKDAYDMAVQIEVATITGGVPIQEPLPVRGLTRDEAVKQ